MSNFMKIRPVWAELFLAGGRMDKRTWRSQLKVFEIFRTRLKSGIILVFTSPIQEKRNSFGWPSASHFGTRQTPSW